MFCYDLCVMFCLTKLLIIDHVLMLIIEQVLNKVLLQHVLMLIFRIQIIMLINAIILGLLFIGL